MIVEKTKRICNITVYEIDVNCISFTHQSFLSVSKDQLIIHVQQLSRLIAFQRLNYLYIHLGDMC